jgi:NAD(P)-dependent dehydrogenase (short-subunit alcohol dehydrogenase family)
MGRLTGKIAVITGGNSGIGLATAKRFVSEGAYVFITGRRQDELDKAVATLGSGVTGVQGDVSNLEDLDRLFATVQAEKGHVDVLFANAGIGGMSPLGSIPEDQFDKVFAVNVKGTRFDGIARLQRVQRNQGRHPKFCTMLGAGFEGYWHPNQCAFAGGYNDARSAQWTGENGKARGSSCRACQSGTP